MNYTINGQISRIKCLACGTDITEEYAYHWHNHSGMYDTKVWHCPSRDCHSVMVVAEDNGILLWMHTFEPEYASDGTMVEGFRLAQVSADEEIESVGMRDNFLWEVGANWCVKEQRSAWGCQCDEHKHKDDDEIPF